MMLLIGLWQSHHYFNRR